MPHCILEITRDLLESIDTSLLMINVSKAINADRIFESDDIKVRLYKIDKSVMGEEMQDHSYISAEIILLDSKSEAQKQDILNGVQDVLISHFKAPNNKFSITSRLSLVNPCYYKRHVNY